MPLINHHLHVWKEGLVKHKICTAGDRTLKQLLPEVLLAMYNSVILVEGLAELNNEVCVTCKWQ